MFGLAVFRVSLAALAVTPAACWSIRRANNITDIFGSGLSSGASIHYPTDADYANTTTQRWSTFDEPTFVVTIKPVTFEDVQYIVKQADAYDLPFFATGGAHGAEPGFASVQNAVNIDLSNFNNMSLDSSTNIFTVGPGIVFSDIYDPLQAAGKELQTGNALCVNLIGATIGAGVGPLQGLHGLIIDALRSVRLVTAAGDLVTASDAENPDLFWAVRGAGANFGIIVEAVYEVSDATNGGQLIEADFQFQPSANASLWEIVRSWDDDYPAEMGITIGGGFNHSNGQPTLGASVSFVGTQAQAQPWLDQLSALDPVVFRNQSIGWNLLAVESGFGSGLKVCVRGQYASHYGVGANQTDVGALTDAYGKFAEFASTRPWYTGSLAIQRYSTAATLAVPESQRGVYPWRDIGILLEINNFYQNSSQDAEVEAFGQAWRSELEAVSGFDSPHIYINYAYGDEGPDVWYGSSNLPRLVALKNQWDPQNKFGRGNPVPLTL